jgi:hypothetical protein
MMPTLGTNDGPSRARPRSEIDSNEPFVLTLWTNDVHLAGRADAAGVQRVGVDLERLEKAARQRGRHTWISSHTIDDLAALRPALTGARLFARVNPLHAGSTQEVDAVLAAGSEVLMLPMVRTAREAERFVGLVSGRALVVLLVECKEAVDRLSDLVAVEGVSEVHLGLNDLAISFGLPNRWLVLASDLVASAARCVLGAGLRFGLGGIGRVNDDTLPIPSDLIYAEYARTGATAALLARSFHAESACDLGPEVAAVHERMALWRRRDAAALANAHAQLTRRACELGVW